MALKELIPWKKTDRSMALRHNQNQSMFDPFEQFRSEMDRMFDNWLTPFTGRTSLMDRSFGNFVPNIDVHETDKEVRVVAELPGMDQKDVEVTLVDGALQIRGEKREEHEENKRDFYRQEVRYGAFERMIPLPAEVDPDKVKAQFKKGVLKITLPKTAEAQSNRRTIPVETA